jgi:hypothetical protein
MDRPDVGIDADHVVAFRGKGVGQEPIATAEVKNPLGNWADRWAQLVEAVAGEADFARETEGGFWAAFIFQSVVFGVVVLHRRGRWQGINARGPAGGTQDGFKPAEMTVAMAQRVGMNRPANRTRCGS